MTRQHLGMTPAFSQDGLVVYQGDVLDVLPQLEAESVNCIVTSPPYWGLRVYSGCPPSIWGGDSVSDEEDRITGRMPHSHEWYIEEPAKQSHYKGKKRWQHLAAEAQETGIPIREVIPEAWGHPEVGRGDTCSRCGAWRGFYGAEPEPDCLAWARGEEPCSRCYVCHTRTVLYLLRRVLRKDGCLFWDIDDSRGGAGNAGGANQTSGEVYRPKNLPTKNLPAKNLALIPERVALAAQSDGWIIRSIAVIPTWMPESSKDRPTDSYRRCIIMARSRSYYWDAQAVRQPATGHERGEKWNAETWPRYSVARGRTGVFTDGRDGDPTDGQRNLGNVWSLPPSSSALPGSHFAAFPLEEPELAIKAACPERVCDAKVCGKPSVRIIGGDKMIIARSDRRDKMGEQGRTQPSGTMVSPAHPETLGWTDCGHGIYSCRDCNSVLTYDYAIQRRGSATRVSTPLVSRTGKGQEQEIPGASVPDVQENILRGQTESDVQSELRSEIGTSGRPNANLPEREAASQLERGPDTEQEWIRLHSSEGSSGGETQRLYSGAQASDGENAGSLSSSKRARPSQEWEQGRQSSRESRGDDERRAHSLARLDNLSELPAHIPSCLECGSRKLRRLTDYYSPGVVLDPFAGTGTTLVAARKLSRRAIGIEASPEFVAGMIERLQRGDDGLRQVHEQRQFGGEQVILL